MEDEFIPQVLSLFKLNDWRSVLELNKNSDNKSAQKLLWVWPSIENLKFIDNYLKKLHANGVVSLGCGCGLFEWLLQCYTDVPVLGVEINREWWESKYSDPLFIPHIYPDLPVNGELLKANFALLFCYFNNRDAFNEYVNNYKGNLIFIIGPGEGRGTHTEPEPFKPLFNKTMLNGAIYGFYFDKQGFIHTKRFNNNEDSDSLSQRNQNIVERRETATWLKFIVIFWSPRVLRAAVKFGLAAMIMNKYERIGFAIMMLCFAF